MKNLKQFVLLSAVFCSVATALYANFYSKINGLSDLALSNIEALAQGESGGNTCTVVEYKEGWKDGCLYKYAYCSDGKIAHVTLIRCTAR